MTETYTLGVNGKLYRGDAGEDDPTAMTEVTNVQDVTITLEADEEEITTRAGGGWKQHAQTLKDCTLEFQLLHQTANENYRAIRDAFLNGTAIALAALDGSATTEGAEGPIGDFVITNFSRPEEIGGVMVNEVTAKLNLFTGWHEVAASS